ncbi:MULTISPECIES: aminopeptidase [Halobacterium]|uniref:Aminopeptidase (Homolog to leucyl aminopeptidase/ aminopeptidase T) n=7 Tax=Halobacterium salinarum TaxID=2242 RepID=Q9HMP2_HALSA|nr:MULTISPECIES: aminopeptidase [Halobacterium]AAG20529.1 aminopeptidase homolog [Halobacterium salinarum NRC-1]MBB6089540.1 aminopeptidase [Halobacterium salinarum]MCF2164290.1 aminopeptidase [Halobacterium salinarum]MCF2167077.1 aminopeptidase [Halobacterium salinarum]MDL0118425.1 aminopeptidase [Halobacterium salinarum]
MDSRIRQHAAVIVDRCIDLQPDENVVVSLPPVAEDLRVALYEKIGEVGANPVMLARGDRGIGTDRAARAYLQAIDAEDLSTPEHLLQLYEHADAAVVGRPHRNVTEQSDVSTELGAAFAEAHRDVLNARLSTKWCLTQYPAPADAQLAGMSTAAYEDFVYDAVNKDWDAVEDHQQQMVDILNPAEEVRIVSGDTTDVTMSVADMTTLNDCGSNNLPAGEVFTAPVPDSVEGEVVFDKPVYHQAREIQGAALTFEDGEVVSFSAEQNEDVLAAILDTDDGARRLGELGIGMNRDIDRFTYNMLFDEKMGDTVHMALGRAYPETVGEGVEQNDSAKHVDMIVDMSEDSFIEVDGEIVQRNGTFVFEDGFDA